MKVSPFHLWTLEGGRMRLVDMYVVCAILPLVRWRRVYFPFNCLHPAKAVLLVEVRLVVEESLPLVLYYFLLIVDELLDAVASIIVLP